jgi:hypothetical protein
MRKGIRQFFLALVGAILTSATAQAATAWDESVHGDLSDDRLNPTALSFASGASTVSGVVGPSSVDIDYFKFVVPDGRLLSAVIVNPGTYVVGAVSFFAIQVGDKITVTPTGGGDGTGALLAFDHFGADDVGKNLLARLLPGQPGLLPGTYSVWLNESSGPAPYSFDFVLSAVPEPAHVVLLLTGLAVCVARGRAQRR